MEKRIFKADGSELLLHDTEDKNWWLQWGEGKEKAFKTFCDKVRILPGLSFNPEREGGKKRGAPEFVWQGHLLDVKVQNQPFFEAVQRFGIPPRYAVTLNWRDVRDVREKYADCLVVYWVNWVPVRYIKTVPRITMPPRVVEDISVEPLHGIWIIPPPKLFELENKAIIAGNLHWYVRRYGDNKGNAKSSYVIDIRDADLLWFDPNCRPLDLR